jgi:hypothetical protein
LATQGAQSAISYVTTAVHVLHPLGFAKTDGTYLAHSNFWFFEDSEKNDCWNVSPTREAALHHASGTEFDFDALKVLS